MPRLTLSATFFLVASLLTATIAASDPASADTAPTLGADYNGDGFADLAVAVRFDPVGAKEAAGSINVLYGSPDGVVVDGNQRFTQATPGVPSIPQPSEGNGLVVKGADFDEDGYADLAVGWPGDVVDGATGAGSVIVLRGSASGLTTEGSQIWNQSSPGVPADVAENDRFGGALAVGDFDGDGHSDLAVGTPFDHVGDTGSAFGQGSLTILRGSPEGLTASGAQRFSKSSSGVPGAAAVFDEFGASLAAGNFGGGLQADLAIGAPSDHEAAPNDGGAVFTLYGSATGLSGTGAQRFSQDTPGVPDGPDSYGIDEFGASLVAGNFGRSAYADLAVGAPNELVDEDCLSIGDGTATRTGSVTLLYGSPDGITTTGSELWTKNTTGVAGTANCDEQFASILAAANLGKSAHADLIVGQPQRGFCTDGGAVSVLYGSVAGITATGSRYISQETAGVPGTGGCDDIFGSALFAGRIRGAEQADLAIGTPCSGPDLNGELVVLSGGTTGVTTAGAQLFSQLTPGVAGPGAFNSQFASAMNGGPQAIFC